MDNFPATGPFERGGGFAGTCCPINGYDQTVTCLPNGQIHRKDKMGKMGKNFLITNESADNLMQLGSKNKSVAPCICCPTLQFAIFSPPVGEAPSQAFAYFFLFSDATAPSRAARRRRRPRPCHPATPGPRRPSVMRYGVPIEVSPHNRNRSVTAVAGLCHQITPGLPACAARRACARRGRCRSATRNRWGRIPHAQVSNADPGGC